MRTTEDEGAPAAQPSDPASAAQSSEARTSVPTEATSSAPPSTKLPPSPHHEDMMREGYDEMPALNEGRMREDFLNMLCDPEITRRVKED